MKCHSLSFAALTFLLCALVSLAHADCIIVTAPEVEVIPPGITNIFLADVVVSNTDPKLCLTDKFGDSEPSIAINPLDTNKIAIVSFSGSWPAAGASVAPIWYSTNQGRTWTKYFRIPIPPKVKDAVGCPCDQTIDYGRDNRLTGSFLTSPGADIHPQVESPGDIYSATAIDPTMVASWKWLLDKNGVAQKTNLLHAGESDQPWLLVNPDPGRPAQDNAYAGYQAFHRANSFSRISAALGKIRPPDFTSDLLSGGDVNADINMGHRLAKDPNNGAMYSLYQVQLAQYRDGSVRIALMLNRSLDGGLSWCLPGKKGCPLGQNTGTVVTTILRSVQPTPKFCTINALRGGRDHVAVDPHLEVGQIFGDVYVANGGTPAPNIAGGVFVYRMIDDGNDGMKLANFGVVNPTTDAALPSVAVASNGVIGVLYDTCDDDGVKNKMKPQLTAHLATSTDKALSFADAFLYQFRTSVADDADPKQRLLGDYQQLKSVGLNFYGAFTANGKAFGRPYDDMDVIFVHATVAP